MAFGYHHSVVWSIAGLLLAGLLAAPAAALRHGKAAPEPQAVHAVLAIPEAPETAWRGAAE
jgi:hypothetical protein